VLLYMHVVNKIRSGLCVLVCSRTLWIGHISKQTTEEELQQELSKHGEATVKASLPSVCFWDCQLLVCSRALQRGLGNEGLGVKVTGSPRGRVIH